MCPVAILAQGKGKGNGEETKIEYRVIWVSPPDPVKIMTEFGKIWSREHGLEFDGVYTKEGDIKQ